MLDKSDVAGAAAAVAVVPTSFVWFVEHSDNSGRQNHPVYTSASSNGRYTVADTEGVNGLNFRSALDPRVVWSDKGTNGFDMVPDYANQIRKNAAIASTLAPLTDPGTPAARENLRFSERAFWLSTTGHRLGVPQTGPSVRPHAGPGFSTGSYSKANAYGADLAFPIPFNEIHNTRYKPALCDVKKAQLLTSDSHGRGAASRRPAHRFGLRAALHRTCPEAAASSGGFRHKRVASRVLFVVLPRRIDGARAPVEARAEGGAGNCLR